MKNKEQKKRIKNKGKMSKLARAMIIIGLILAVAGIAVGIYFLLRTPDRDSDDPVLPPEQQEWVDAIIDSNNAPADLTEQSFVLPSVGAYGEEIELSDVVFVSNEYIVVETVSGKVLFIRDESNDLTGGEPIIVDSFVSDDLDVCYDDVLSIYGKYALVSCSIHDKSFVVDINSREVLCDVSDFTKVEFKNGFVFLNKPFDNGYMNVKFFHLDRKVIALETIAEDQVYSCKLLDGSIKMQSVKADKVYSYNMIDNELQLLSETSVSTEVVDPTYEPVDGEVVFDVAGQQYKFSTREVVLITTKTHQLVQKRVPTTDYAQANFVDNILGGDGEVVKVHYVVSHYIKEIASGSTQDFDSGYFLETTGDYGLDGFYMIKMTPFDSFDDEGNVNLRSTDRFVKVFNESLIEIFTYDYVTYGDLIFFTGENFVTSNGLTSGIIDMTGSDTGIIYTDYYNVSGQNVWNNKFIVESAFGFGVSDTDGNVIVSPRWESLSPIVNGFMVGYKDGHYYNINLNNNTASVIDNYCADFHGYVMMGMGCYLTHDDQTGTYSIHNEKGVVLYGNISEIVYTDIESADDALNLIVTVGTKSYLFSCSARDKVFANQYLDGNYVPAEVDDSVDYESDYSSLLITDLLSFRNENMFPNSNNVVSNVTVNANQSTPEGSNELQAGNAVAGDEIFDAVPTGTTDLSSITGYVDFVNKIKEYEKFASRNGLDCEWSADIENEYETNWLGNQKLVSSKIITTFDHTIISGNEGEIFENSGEHFSVGSTTEFLSTIIFCPVISKWTDMGDPDDYEGTVTYFKPYIEYFGCKKGDNSAGAAYGYKKLAQAQVDLGLDGLGADSGNGLVPSFDSNNGKITDQTIITRYSSHSENIYHAGTLFFRFEESAIIAVTRLYLDGLKQEGTAAGVGAQFAYYLGTAFAEGINVSEMFAGHYSFNSDSISTVDKSNFTPSLQFGTQSGAIPYAYYSEGSLFFHNGTINATSSDRTLSIKNYVNQGFYNLSENYHTDFYGNVYVTYSGSFNQAACKLEESSSKSKYVCQSFIMGLSFSEACVKTEENGYESALCRDKGAFSGGTVSTNCAMFDFSWEVSNLKKIDVNEFLTETKVNKNVEMKTKYFTAILENKVLRIIPADGFYVESWALGVKAFRQWLDGDIFLEVADWTDITSSNCSYKVPSYLAGEFNNGQKYNISNWNTTDENGVIILKFDQRLTQKDGEEEDLWSQIRNLTVTVKPIEYEIDVKLVYNNISGVLGGESPKTLRTVTIRTQRTAGEDKLMGMQNSVGTKGDLPVYRQTAAFGFFVNSPVKSGEAFAKELNRVLNNSASSYDIVAQGTHNWEIYAEKGVWTIDEDGNLSWGLQEYDGDGNAVLDGNGNPKLRTDGENLVRPNAVYFEDAEAAYLGIGFESAVHDAIKSAVNQKSKTISLYIPLTPKTHSFKFDYRDGWVDGDGDFVKDVGEANTNVGVGSVIVKFSGLAADSDAGEWLKALDESETVGNNISLGVDYSGKVTSLRFDKSVMSNGISFAVEYDPNRTDTLVVAMNNYYQSMYKKAVGENAEFDANAVNTAEAAAYYALSIANAYPTFVMETYTNIGFQITKFANGNNDEIYAPLGASGAACTTRVNDLGDAGHTNYIKAAYTDKEYNLKFLHNATEGFKLFFDDGGHVIGTTLSVPNGKGPEDVTTIGYDVVYQVDQNGTMTAMSGVAASGGLFKTYSSIARFVDGSGNPSFGNLYQNGALIAASFVVGQNSVVLNDHLKAVYEFKGWFTAKGNSFDTSGGGEPAGKIPDYDEDDGKLDGTIELYAVFEANPVDFDFDVELSGDKVDDYAYTIANNGFVVESVSHSVSGDIATGIVHGGESGIGSANRTINIALKVDHYYIDRISFVWNNYSLGLNTSETEVWTASVWNSEKQTGGEFGVDPSTNVNIETSVEATEALYDSGTDRHYTLYEITLSNCPVGEIAFASDGGWSFVAGEILIHFSDKNLSIGGENDGSEGVVESPDVAAVSDLEGSQNDEVVVCSSSVTSASFDAKMANVDFNFDDTDDGCVEIVKKDNQSAEGTVLSTLSSDEGGFLQNIHKDDILEMIAKSTGFVGSDPNIVMDGTQFRMMTEFVRNVNFFVQLGTDTVQGSGSVEMAVRYWNGSAYATRILTIAAGTEYAFGIEFVFGFDYVSADAGNYSLSISSVSAVLKMYVLDGNNLCELLMPDGGWVLKADYEGSNPTIQNTWSQSTSILEFDKSVSASEILITNARRFRAAIIERGNATYDEGYGVVGAKYFGFSTKASDELFADDVNYEIEIYPLLTGSRENQKLPLANATGAYNTAQLFIFEPVTTELFDENGDDINTIDGMGVMIVTRAKSNIHFSASFAEIAHNERVGTFVVDDAGNKSANVNNTFAYGAAPIVSATGNAIANASGVHVTNGYLSMFDGGKVGVEPTYFYAKPGKGQYLKQIDVLYNGVTYTILKNGEMTLDESAGSVYFAEGIASLTRAYVLNDGSSNKVLGCFYLLNEENVVNPENGEFAFAIFGAWDDFTVTVMFSEIKFVQVVAEEEAVKTFVNARGDNYGSVLGSETSNVEEYFARATQSGTIATEIISKMISSIELVVKNGENDETKNFEIDSSTLTVQKKVTGEAGQQTVQYIFTIAIMETSVKTKVSTVVEDEYSTIISSAKGSDLIEMFSKSAGVITPIEGVTLAVPSGKSFVQGIEYLSGDHQTVILTMNQSRRVILSSKLGIGGENFRDEWNIEDGSQYSNNTETTGFSASFSAVFGRSQTGSMRYDRSAASGSVDGVKAVFFGKKLVFTVSQTNGYHSPSAKVWYVDSLGTTKIGNPIFEGDIQYGQNIEVVASDLDQKYILIEVSQKATEYEISYDPNGGVFDVTVQKSSKIHNVKSRLNERAFDSVKKAGYEFLGYSLEDNENVKNGEIFTRAKVDFVAFDDVAATGNIMRADGTNQDHNEKIEITLYAVWAARELEIAYDLNDGTGSTEGELIESATTLANGDKLYHDHFYGYDPTVEGENKKVKDLAGARRDGYVFLGWSTSLNASDIVPEKDGFIEDKDYVNAQNADDENVITLHAIWRAIEYTVDFDENKGTGSSDPETADEYKITFDSEFANALPAISRNGYTFGGWFLDQACEGPKISSGGNAGTGANTTFNKNLYDAFEAVNGVDDEAKTIKLYAKWEVQSFTIFLDLANTGLYGYGQTGVTFDFDGEYVSSVGIQIEFDKTVELPSVKSSVYEFAGWSFKNDNGESGVGSSYVPTASKVTSGVLEAFSFDNNAFETFEENKDAADGKYVLYAAYRPKVFDFVIAQGSNGYVGGEGLTGNVASNGSFVFGTSQDNEATYAGTTSTRYFVIDAIPNEGYKIKSLTITNTDADNVIHYATINLIWDSEDRMIWVGSDGSTQMIVEANAYFEGLQIDTSEYDETNGINTLRLVIVGAKADIKVAVQFDKQTYEITAVKQTYKSGVLMNEKYSEEKYLVEYGDYVNQTETLPTYDTLKNSDISNIVGRDGQTAKIWSQNTLDGGYGFVGYYDSFDGYLVESSEFYGNATISVSADSVAMTFEQIKNNKTYYMIFSNDSDDQMVIFHIWDPEANDGNGAYVIYNTGEDYDVGGNFNTEYVSAEHKLLKVPAPNTGYWPEGEGIIFNGYVMGPATYQAGSEFFGKFFTSDADAITELYPNYADVAYDFSGFSGFDSRGVTMVGTGTSINQSIHAYAIYDRQVFEIDSSSVVIDDVIDSGDFVLGTSGKYISIDHNLAWYRESASGGYIFGDENIRSVALTDAQYQKYLDQLSLGSERETALRLAIMQEPGSLTENFYVVSYLYDMSGEEYIYLVSSNAIKVSVSDWTHKIISTVDGSEIVLMPDDGQGQNPDGDDPEAGGVGTENEEPETGENGDGQEGAV